MKKIIFITAALISTTACAETPAPKGHWVQGANKMSIFVPAKEEKDCKYVPGWSGHGQRATFGYQYICK